MIDYNPFAPEIRQNPYPHYARLRRESPVLKLDPMGFWIVTRHEDVQTVLKSPQLFSSEAMAGPQGHESGYIPSIITMDPPVHGRYRSLVSRAFTPKMIAELEPRIREITRELTANAGRTSEFDVIGEVALPLPVRVIAEMLGVEPARYSDFKRWSDLLVGQMMRQGAAPEQIAYETAENGAFNQYFRWTIQDRRRQPKNDLISALVQAEVEGEHLTEDDIFSFAGLLLVAGNETTTNLLGNMVLALLSNPDQLARLIEDPSLIPAAVEETLRYDSPVQMLFRFAREDVELSGQIVPKGSLVWPVLGSANRDETRFPNPDRFDITRETNGHVAFGNGIHFCIGAPLARLESRIAIEEMLPHLATMKLPERSLEYIDAFFLRGLQRLPLITPEPVMASMPPSPMELARLIRASGTALVKEGCAGVKTLLRRRLGRSDIGIL
ncbi:MAG: cytochrome P450 [Chloroflexota bacterium]